MDLGNPMSSVIPAVHGVVLEVLARSDRPLSGRQAAALVADLAGHRQVNVVLGQLTEAGLVLREHHPPAYLYRLNHDHVAAEAIIALSDLRGILLARMRNLANAWHPKSAALWLFGSAARGDGNPSSDVDVLVLRPDAQSAENPHWIAQSDHFSAQVRAWSGNNCEVLEYSEKEFAALVARGERLITELRRDAIRIAGDTVAARTRSIAGAQQ